MEIFKQPSSPLVLRARNRTAHILLPKREPQPQSELSEMLELNNMLHLDCIYRKTVENQANKKRTDTVISSQNTIYRKASLEDDGEDKHVFPSFDPGNYRVGSSQSAFPHEDRDALKRTDSLARYSIEARKVALHLPKASEELILKQREGLDSRSRISKSDSHNMASTCMPINKSKNVQNVIVKRKGEESSTLSRHV